MNLAPAFETPRATEESLRRLRDAAATLGRPMKFMEVCGTHTMSAFRSGLHSLMPINVTLLSGPGCPVCVTSQGDIDQLIELARRPGITLCTYGDMLRVMGSDGSLEQARAEGADVRIVYSSLDAVELAAADRRRNVVFAAVGFETTTPASAAAVEQAQRLGLENFSILASHKLIIPAMRALLESGDVRVDGFMCPGHVSVIIGAAAFEPIVREYHKPCVIAGFEGPQIAAALARLTELVSQGRAALENLYSQAVTEEGNLAAQAIINRVFMPADWHWRGLGELKGSGLTLRPEYARYDARVLFSLGTPQGKEIPGCRCGEVITGRVTPIECKLFGTACTPVRALGPCMVSSEGTCQAWFKYKRLNKTGKARSVARD
ncbi:MAG: hydrogenase formation protein HypD [Tepidisphaeraceae bacterium]|jgi:hydrogenase expression/formation protein HypD